MAKQKKTESTPNRKTDLSERMKRLRENLGDDNGPATQREIADRLKMTTTWVSKIENGEITSMHELTHDAFRELERAAETIARTGGTA